MQKHEMIREYIVQKIESGELKKGSRLPSCRDVSKELSVNKITVNKVYHSMEEEHLIYGIPKGGFYVVEDLADSAVKHQVYDFATVTPDSKLIPYREFSHVINKSVDHYKADLFSYEPTAGLSELRHTLKDMFENNAIYTGLNNIVITNGAQQAIHLLLQMLFKDSKAKFLVEAPTYNLVLKMAEVLGIEIACISRENNGFDAHELENIFKTGSIRTFYLMPRHHNPTGFSLEEKQKRKIAELAAKYDVLILEDDYLADLGSSKSKLPIHYYDTADKTIYIRSFSKTFMPGMRLGAAVLPEYLTERFTEQKRLTDLNTSRLPQAALDLFIKSGMYEKQAQKVRKSYEEKLRRSREIIEALSPDWIRWHIPSHGIFIWGEIENGRCYYQIEKLLAKNDILIKSGEDSYLKDKSINNCFRLCISGIPLDGIKDGLGKMMQVLNSMKE